MHVIIALLVVIVLLLIFGPWLLAALGILFLALLAAIVWLFKWVVIPLLLVCLALAGVALVGFLGLLLYGAIQAQIAKRKG